MLFINSNLDSLCDHCGTPGEGRPETRRGGAADVCICVYIYIYIYMYIDLYIIYLSISLSLSIYIYMYIERDMYIYIYVERNCGSVGRYVPYLYFWLSMYGVPPANRTLSESPEPREAEQLTAPADYLLTLTIRYMLLSIIIIIYYYL